MDEASTGNYPALHTIFIIFEGGNELTIVHVKIMEKIIQAVEEHTT